MPRPKVLLVGSSIFEDWGEGPRDVFRRADVVNAAIGGTQTVDWLPRVEEVLREHRPDVLCVYCGSNDLSHGRPAGQVADHLREWRNRVEAFDPAIAFVYFSILKCPEKAGRYDDIDTVHASVRQHARPGDHFVDVNPVMLIDAEPPQHPEGFFLDDGVHLTARAYTAMAERARVELADAAWV
ncbi:MAG: GDSL-type esterase/lipase family protein [Planctomycetota bacterium]